MGSLGAWPLTATPLGGQRRQGYGHGIKPNYRAVQMTFSTHKQWNRVIRGLTGAAHRGTCS